VTSSDTKAQWNKDKTPVTCGGQNLKCALFLNPMIYQLKEQILYLQEKQLIFICFPYRKKPILMSKSDMIMFVWEKNMFYYSNNLLSCLVLPFIVLFHILGPKLDTLKLCLKHRLDNKSDLGLFLKGCWKRRLSIIYFSQKTGLFFAADALKLKNY
jgi:hypothetical protein